MEWIMGVHMVEFRVHGEDRVLNDAGNLKLLAHPPIVGCVMGMLTGKCREL